MKKEITEEEYNKYLENKEHLINHKFNVGDICFLKKDYKGFSILTPFEIQHFYIVPEKYIQHNTEVTKDILYYLVKDIKTNNEYSFPESILRLIRHYKEHILLNK